jgi:acyl-CoA thioesterase YciA
MSERVPAVDVLLLPKDANAFGTIFGGVILSHVELASAIAFDAPAVVGDLVNLFTETTRVGHTSVTGKVPA